MATRHVLPLLAAAALVPALAPAAASADAWTCDASAVTGSVLGTGAIEPAVAGTAGGACRTVESRAGVPLPAALGSGTLVAGTSLTGTPGDVASQTAIAAGGLARLESGSVRDLGLKVPQVELPAAARSLQVDLSAVNAVLPASVPLPVGPLGTTVPVPVPPITATPASVDIGDRVDELVGAVRRLPDLRLLELRGAMAFAKGSCINGRAQLNGFAQVAGLTVLGRELPTDRAVRQTLTLLEGGTVDLTALDLAGPAVLPAGTRAQLQAVLDLVPDAVDGQVLAAVDTALDDAVAALPELPVAAATASVEVTPGGQSGDARSLTQVGPRVQVAVLGRPVLDLAIGRATVGAEGMVCGLGDVASDGDAEPAALRCTTRRVVLTEVVRRGRQVRLSGIADPALSGETVRLVLAGRRTVAKAVVRRDGRFAARAQAPGRALRDTNAARYRAIVEGQRSLDLKLTRRMVVESLQRRGDRVVLTGRVVRPLAGPAAPITVQRRVSCSRYVDVGRIRPDAGGRFRAVMAAPPAGQAAAYRLRTRVRKSVTNPKTYPTFTLPQVVESTR